MRKSESDIETELERDRVRERENVREQSVREGYSEKG